MTGRRRRLGCTSGSPTPRIAILDWMMPEMDGVEVCRRARSLETRQPTYIILLTALGEKEHLPTGFEAGADDYVGKPLRPGGAARASGGRPSPSSS